jgi:pyruvate,water dikinase
VLSVLELFRIAACTTWQYLFFRRRLETFEREIDGYARDTHRERLPGMTRRELAGQLRRFIDIRRHRWKNASLADAAAMVCYALLKEVTTGISAGGDESLHNRLLRALPGVPSSQPPIRLWALSRLIRQDRPLAAIFARGDAAATLHAIRTDGRFREFRAAFDRYLEDWGFRSSCELMLTEPGLDENPLPAIEILARHAADDREAPAAVMARQAAARRRETGQVLRRLAVRAPHRAVALWVALSATRRAITFRERARLKQALLYSRLRGLAREIGSRLASTGDLESQDEVFMLRWEEIDELLTGRAMFPDSVKTLVRLRANEHATSSTWQPPGTFVLENGDHWRPGARTRVVAPALRQEPDSTSERIFRGTSACGGVATARASVLEGVADAHRLGSGEILVTRQTDPGWAPVFCLIGGLVIERGGMLSHGAVIAREFGLPCVVGVPDVTRRIPDGALVTVDGDAGTCRIVEPRAEPAA